MNILKGFSTANNGSGGIVLNRGFKKRGASILTAAKAQEQLNMMNDVTKKKKLEEMKRRLIHIYMVQKKCTNNS